MPTSPPPKPNYIDVEVCVVERQMGGSSVEIMVNGEPFPPGVLHRNTMPQVSPSKMARFTAPLADWLLAYSPPRDRTNNSIGLAGRRCIRLHIDTSGFNHRTYSTDSKPRVLLLNTHSGPRLLVFRVNPIDTEWAAFSSDGSLIVVLTSSCETFDAHTGKRQFSVPVYMPDISNPATIYTPTVAHVIATSDSHPLRFGDARIGQEVLFIPAHSLQSYPAAYSPDGMRKIVNHDDHTACVQNTRSGELYFTLQGHSDGINSAAFSPDGYRIVTASNDHTARIWDANNGKELLQLRGHTKSVLFAAFNPTGQRIVTGGYDQTVRVWDVYSGKELLAWYAHEYGVSSGVYSPDGMTIVTVGEDDTDVLVWDAGTGDLVLSLRGHYDGVMSAMFSPDGASIITASADGTVRIWPATMDQLLALIGSLIQRDPPLLTPEERRQLGVE